MANEHWSREEVETIVADYLQMLTAELAGQAYNKAEHRRRLGLKLNDRSEGSIERKHQNISAVMIELSCPWINGYKPLNQYQQLLFDVVADRLMEDAAFDEAALAAVQMPAVHVPVPAFEGALVEPPKLETTAREPRAAPYMRKPIKRDYLEREAANARLGKAGEQFVLEFESWRLHQQGYAQLANRVEHVASTRGDGLGYDVLSFEPSGKERFIEVKTTRFGKETPFYISNGELAFSKERAEQFFLYRVFEFQKAPRMFELQGSVEQRCYLNPILFRANFA